MQNILKKYINKKLYIIILISAVLLRLLIAFSQRVFLVPEGAALDDALMVRAAQSIVDGNWLGAYGGVAVSKNMGFALWLAVLHVLKIPLLLANAMLWVLASAFAVFALKPLLKGNLMRAVLFAFFVLHPISYAQFNMRAYRDAIFAPLCFLFFAGVVGAALRVKSNKKAGLVFCLIISGVGLGCCWLVREDGAALLPFAILGLLAVAFFAFFNKQGKQKLKACLMPLPFCVTFVFVLAFSFANKAHYGVFMVNDLSGGNFPKAYGALVAAAQGEDGYHRAVPVTQKALSKMYDEIESLKKLRPSLTKGAAFSGFSSPETGEFGGSFYYALKLAADYEGLTPSAQSAQDFWQKMHKETVEAVQSGRLKSEKPGKTTLPRWNNELFAPMMKEAGASVVTMMAFTGCEPRPQESIGTKEKIDEMASFLHSKVQTGYVAGTSEPYYNTLQKAIFLFCDIIRWVYVAAGFLFFAFAVYSTLKHFGKGCAVLFKKKRYSFSLMLSVLSLGLFLSAVLRVFIAAYLEVAAFEIGTYIMYVASAYAPLILFFVLGSVLGLQQAGEKVNSEVA